MFEKKKRRARRNAKKNWPQEIVKGKISDFYNSTDWDIIREQALMRDKFICQFYNGQYSEKGLHPIKIDLVRATHVHHKLPIKERPDLALDLDNVISLSHQAHEIIEGRYRNRPFGKRKRPLTIERW